MTTDDAMGFVETIGLVAAIEAADAMAKAARVRIKTVVNADAGLLAVICEGDVAACQAAVDAGRAAASRVGQCVSTNLIPRPYSDVDALIVEKIGSNITKTPPARQAEDKK